MYGSINYDNKYELPIIETRCLLCNFKIEIRKGLPSYCSACLREKPQQLAQYRKYLKGTPIAKDVGSRIVSIPMYPNLSIKEQEFVIEAVNGYFK